MKIAIIDTRNLAKAASILDRDLTSEGVITCTKRENILLNKKGIETANMHRRTLEDTYGLSFAELEERTNIKQKMFEETLYAVRKARPNWGNRVPKETRPNTSMIQLNGNTVGSKAFNVKLQQQRAEVTKKARHCTTKNAMPKWSQDNYTVLAEKFGIKVRKGTKFNQHSKKWVNTLIHPTERLTEVFRYPANIRIEPPLATSWTDENEVYSLTVTPKGITLISINLLPILESTRVVQGKKQTKQEYLTVQKAKVSRDTLHNWADLHANVSSLAEAEFNISKSGILTFSSHTTTPVTTEKIKAVTPKHKKYVGSYRYLTISHAYGKITYLKMGKINSK